jgi:hypothetical protein
MIIFALAKFWTIQICISKNYKEKTIFETLDDYKLFLFSV